MKHNEELFKGSTGWMNRTFSLVILIVCVVLVYWINPEPLQRIIKLLLSRDMVGSIEYIRSFGPYAAIVSFLIIVFINITAILPNIFILAATGIIFGVFEGALISWAAECVGVTISFMLMRYFFLDYAHQVIVRSNALKKIDDFSGKNGFRIMLIARSIPFIPSGFITALGALSSIGLADYILSTLIGKLPSAWIEVTLGHDLASYHEHTLRLTLLVLVSVGAYGIFLWFKNRNKDC